MPQPDPSLVAKRLKYIDRQRELHKERVNVVIEGRSPEGTGAANRHGMPKLPVGQRPVPNWPVLDLGDSPVIALDSWRLEIGGRCENPFAVSWPEFLDLPQVEDVSDFHCVTTWSRMDNTWKGTKWIRKIEFLAGNKRGFWEERGYSDTAEPWYDDRYSY